jgi:hypothetical protein
MTGRKITLSWAKKSEREIGKNWSGIYLAESI